MTCEFAKECNLYSAKSFTCTHNAVTFNGGFYCGRARKLALEREDRNAQIDGEMLYQQTGRLKK